MQLFVLVFCILYSAVFSEPVSKRSGNEGKDSPLIWLILKQLNSFEARIEKLQDLARENERHIVSLSSKYEKYAIDKDDQLINKVNRYAVNNKKEIDHLKENIGLDKRKLEKQINRVLLQTRRDISNMSGGDTYVRWGRKTCPSISGTTLVYSGYTGGGLYNHPGAAAEYVCLPKDPNYLKTSGTNNAFIYGAEFETNVFGSNVRNYDVPCSVCHVKFGTTIMIPGKTTCNTGWILQYAGNLAAGAAGHRAASSFACVDLNPELYYNSRNHDGKLLYDVLGFCGALPCPPYKHRYPLTCAVCSK